MTAPDFGEEDFLCYEVLRQRGARGDIPKTEFYKLSYIAYKELQKEGIEVPLPTFWYEHGPIIDVDLLGEFFHTQSKKWGSNRGEEVLLEEGISTNDFQVDKQQADIIRRIVREVVEKFAGEYDTSVAKNYTYEEHAPNRFIVEFNHLRNDLAEMDTSESITDRFVSGVNTSFEEIFSDTSESSGGEFSEEARMVRNHLDVLVQEYRQDQYSHMYQTFLRWESISRQMIRNEALGEFESLALDFWKTLVDAELRIVHAENEPATKLQRWRNRRDSIIESFEEKLEGYRESVIENRESTSVLNEVAESYSKVVRDMYRNGKG